MKIKDDVILKKFNSDLKSENLKIISSEFYFNFLDELKQFLLNNNSVQLRGLGTFNKVKYKDRQANDFKKNVRIMVKGKTKIKFLPAKTLIKKLNIKNKEI